MKRLALTSLFAAALLWGVGYHCAPEVDAAEATLHIGSKAPALDVEHWIQDGNGFFKPVEKFEEGKIYVVEFWATWCGPCIESMPHIAELQNKYRGEGVQIISITDESVDEVKELLIKEYPGEEGKSFGDITAAYSLTADPDRSAHDDYMLAYQAEGIPTAFVVGKTGLVEWSGHPMSMEEPLAAIIDGSWDRDAFVEQVKIEKQLQKDMNQLASLAQSGDIKGALQFIAEREKATDAEEIKTHWVNIRHNIKLSTNQLDGETLSFFRDQLADMERTKNVLEVIRLGNDLFGISSQGAKVKPLSADVIESLKRLESDVPTELAVVYHNTSALLHEIEGNYQAAADSQSKGIAAAEPRQAERMQTYLKELQEKAAMADEKDEDAKEKNS